MAKFGLNLFAVNKFATMIWPPTGIALAALILYGYDLWPAILFGALAVNILTGASPLVALGIAIGNTLEAVVGTYFLRKYVGLYRSFERLYDTLLFIGIIGLIATVISASLGVLSLYLGGLITTADMGNTWFAWWIGDTLGALVITPFLLVCVRPTRPWNADSLGWFEIISGTSFLVLSNMLIFWYPIRQPQSTPLLYLILFPLIWGGIRFGSRGMTIGILLTSIIAVSSTALGHGPFVTNPPGDGLLYLQIFIGTLAITFLIFLSIVKERKLATIKLNEHVGELERALQKIKSEDKAKSDFLATLAHELRNPLAPILSSLELLQTSPVEESHMHRLFSTMETNTHIMSRLLDDLLDVSRISRKKFKLNTETFSLQAVIDQSIDSTRPHIESKKHTLSVYVPEETVWLTGDPVRIEQALVNLIVNASKYTNPNGKIALCCEIEEDVVLVRVTDTGVGIDPASIERIFEPFLQLSRDNMRADTGLGIGLSLTKKLIELHNGQIVAKSKGLGYGSEFIITLPIPHNVVIPMGITETTSVFKALLAGTEGNKSYKAKATTAYKILVVDDNESAADGMKELLRHKGHTTQAVYDGREIVKIIKTFRPEVVILDIGMPYLDGYEVAREIRAEFNDSKDDLTLIALTGYGQEGDKIKAQEAGFDYHLTKPVSVLDIEKILNEL